MLKLRLGSPDWSESFDDAVRVDDMDGRVYLDGTGDCGPVPVPKCTSSPPSRCESGDGRPRKETDRVPKAGVTFIDSVAPSDCAAVVIAAGAVDGRPRDEGWSCRENFSMLDCRTGELVTEWQEGGETVRTIRLSSALCWDWEREWDFGTWGV